MIGRKHRSINLRLFYMYVTQKTPHLNTEVHHRVSHIRVIARRPGLGYRPVDLASMDDPVPNRILAACFAPI